MRFIPEKASASHMMLQKSYLNYEKERKTHPCVLRSFSIKAGLQIPIFLSDQLYDKLEFCLQKFNRSLGARNISNI